MPKVTWVGEPESGAKENVWQDITFPQGQAVEVSDEQAEALKKNRFFKVAGEKVDPETKEIEAAAKPKK